VSQGRWFVSAEARSCAGGPIRSGSQCITAQAIRDGLATNNPFAHLRTPSEVNTARALFVDRSTFQQTLDACPDHEWRLLLALARYGGLRTPSEPLALEWADLNWERERFRAPLIRFYMKQHSTTNKSKYRGLGICRLRSHSHNKYLSGGF
jgi:integrase